MGKAGFKSPCDGAEGQCQGMGDLVETQTLNVVPGGMLSFSKAESPGGFMEMLGCFLPMEERSGSLGVMEMLLLHLQLQTAASVRAL